MTPIKELLQAVESQKPVDQDTGHASERYVWRYVTPSESDMDQAAESLWE